MVLRYHCSILPNSPISTLCSDPSLPRCLCKEKGHYRQTTACSFLGSHPPYLPEGPFTGRNTGAVGQQQNNGTSDELYRRRRRTGQRSGTYREADVPGRPRSHCRRTPAYTGRSWRPCTSRRGPTRTARERERLAWSLPLSDASASRGPLRVHFAYASPTSASRTMGHF